MITQNNLQEADGTLDDQKTNSESGAKEGNTQENSIESDKEVPQPESTEKSELEFQSGSEKDDKNNEDQDIENLDDDDESPSKKIDYNSYSLEHLVSDLKQLLKSDDIHNSRPQINAIRKVFNNKFSAILNEKKEAFLAEGGNSIDFSFDSSIKKEFNALSKSFREKNEEYQKKITQSYKQNLEARLQIIEDIKGLIDVNQNSNTTYNKFKNLQEEWRKLGKVPSKDANNVWNNYRHHVEKFYDFLHLDRDLRERDYQHNLEKKQKLIKSAEALASEKNLGRAFRELQALHKIWKEDLGPVAKEYSEVLWEQFGAASKVINDKRKEYNEQLEQELLVNFEAKEAITARIKELTNTQNDKHVEWQKRIKEVELLREEYFKIGIVPRKLKRQSWKNFTESLKNFNKTKNNFYKQLKKSHAENFNKKKELIEIAQQNKDSEDLETTVVLMKNIQNQWKKTGHVSRRDSKKLWTEFRAACNHFFERYYEQKNSGTPEENEAFVQKEQLFDKIKSYTIGEDKKADLKALKDFSKQWNALGRVPKNKRFIDKDFFKKLSQLFEGLGVDEDELKVFKYTNKIQELSKDPKALNNEISFVRKKIEDISSEINQLENNLQFFSNVEDDNPMVMEVKNKIEKQKNKLDEWNKKLSNIKKVLND